MSKESSPRQHQADDLDSRYARIEPEICFEIPESGGLCLDSRHLGAAALDYLSYRIARNPSDLVSHLRRIILCGKLGNADRLCAALLDLFIALGESGSALRSRLLERYRPGLSVAQYRTLISCQDAAAVEAGAFSDASVLTKGITGSCSLIRPIAGEPPEPGRDPLQEAREHLEYSQVEAAREVLERAVLMHPERKELQTELLEIYRASRDAGNFRKTYDALSRSGGTLSDDWRRVSSLLSEHA